MVRSRWSINSSDVLSLYALAGGLLADANVIMFQRPLSQLLLTLLLITAVSGCSLVLPEVMHQPLVHNPFPQFSKIAVLPFFNQSNEPTVDGRQFALDYFAELQSIPGFEVVPVGVAERTAKELGIDLADAESRRYLANQLGVDVIVIGTVTDYSPYYPPRCGIRVDWYAANAGFHEIPAGYGLPWGTPQEEYIPESLVFEAEMALARKQLDTQSPNYEPPRPAMQAMPNAMPRPSEPRPFPMQENQNTSESGADEFMHEELPAPDATTANKPVVFDAPLDETKVISPDSVTTGPIGTVEKKSGMISLPPSWPDARGFTPPGPMPRRPELKSFDGPVISHTRIFNASDTEFTAALASYVGFKDDARVGGWESYLDRSDDFIRFCCHLHLTEMLSARGGGGESRVVRRWSPSR